MTQLKFGTVYFNHPNEKEYFGPAATRELGANCMQIDFAEVSMWYQVEKGKGTYDWTIVDKAYDTCEREGIEPIPSLCHHFAPPDWVSNGPFNDTVIEAPEYGSRLGLQFQKLTTLQKSFADFVTAFVKRYGDRTNLYMLSHEWNLAWMFCSKKDSPEYQKLLSNQVVCTLLAYRIVREHNPTAKFTYGLFTNYRRDRLDGIPITSLYNTVEEFPFGPSFMIRKYLETGNRDFLELLKTIYVFYTCYTNNLDGITPIFIDDKAGEAAEALFKGNVNVDGKDYPYKDFVKEIIVNPITISGKWCFNTEKSYTEKEQAAALVGSLKSIVAANCKGVPISTILACLVDKNEYSSRYAFDPWLMVPEGLYKMKADIDPLKRGPTTWDITYVPKEAASEYKRFISGQRG